MAMLFVTHDLALASDLCDHIAVVYAGQVREHGSRRGGPAAAARPVHAGPAGEHPQPPRGAGARFLPGAPPDLREALPGCRFAPRCPLVFEPCAEPPPLTEVAPGHVARCWLVAPP